MSTFIKWATTALFAVSMVVVSTAMYADKGGNSEGGKGQGKSEKVYKNKESFKLKDPAPGDQKVLKGDRDGEFGDIGARVKSRDWPRSSPRFSDADRTVIINYFNANPFVVAPLPPGIAKNLVRGKRLPPGIAKQYLPRSLFPAYPPQYEYIVVGRDVLLVDPATAIIVDVLRNLLR
jgi:hypothetical protein